MQSREINAQPSVEITLTSDESNELLTFIEMASASLPHSPVNSRFWRLAADLAAELRDRGANICVHTLETP